MDGGTYFETDINMGMVRPGDEIKIWTTDGAYLEYRSIYHRYEPAPRNTWRCTVNDKVRIDRLYQTYLYTTADLIENPRVWGGHVLPGHWWRVTHHFEPEGVSCMGTVEPATILSWVRCDTVSNDTLGKLTRTGDTGIRKKGY